MMMAIRMSTTWDEVRALARERYAARFNRPFTAQDDLYLGGFRQRRNAQREDLPVETEARAAFDGLEKAARHALEMAARPLPKDLATRAVYAIMLSHIRPQLAMLVDLIQGSREMLSKVRGLPDRRDAPDWKEFRRHVTIPGDDTNGELTDSDIAVLYVLAGFEELTEAEMQRMTAAQVIDKIRRRVAAARLG